MLRWNRKQRTALSESLRQVGNLTLGALGLAQFVAGRPIAWPFVIAGAIGWAICMLLGLTLLDGEES
jgi:hypothetical protein